MLMVVHHNGGSASTSLRIMPSRNGVNEVISWFFERITSTTRHYQSHRKIAHGSKRRMVRISCSHNDVIEDFDFKNLAGSDKIACDFDVRFRWCPFTTWMIMCDYYC